MQQIVKRIEQMERLYDEVSAATGASVALDARTLEKIRTLEAYMDSGLWLEDYRRDERGELPAGLKRGVLSEDGLYNLLTDIREKEREV